MILTEMSNAVNITNESDKLRTIVDVISTRISGAGKHPDEPDLPPCKP